MVGIPDYPTRHGWFGVDWEIGERDYGLAAAGGFGDFARSKFALVDVGESVMVRVVA